MPINRSHILPIAALLVALTISSCGGTTDEIEPTPTSFAVEDGSEAIDPAHEEPSTDSTMITGACSNPYFPVVNNANWAFAASGGEIGPYAFSSTVSEVFPDRFTLTLEFEDLTLTQHWECKPEGLVGLELGGGIAATVVTGDVESKLETSNIEGVTIPASITAGDEWAHSMDVSGSVALGDGLSGTAEGRAISSFRAMGMENITVPAGTFEALRVDSEFTLDLNVTTDEFSLPVAFNGTGSTWYVPNLGWVMQSSSSTFFELVTTEIIELQTYSIP